MQTRSREEFKIHFLSRVKITTNNPLECWEWTGSTNAKGYGILKWGGQGFLAHRIAYMLEHDVDIKEDNVIQHTCNNRLCCNYHHLKASTQADNIAYMFECDRANRAKGENSGRAKITEMIALIILNSSLPIKDLAVQYGISWSHVNNIQKRRTWRHLNAENLA